MLKILDSDGTQRKFADSEGNVSFTCKHAEHKALCVPCIKGLSSKYSVNKAPDEVV